MTPLKTFGEVIREARKSRNLGIKQLVSMLPGKELSVTYISMLENDKTRPSLSLVYKFAHVFEINTRALFETTEALYIDKICSDYKALRTFRLGLYYYDGVEVMTKEVLKEYEKYKIKRADVLLKSYRTKYGNLCDSYGEPIYKRLVCSKS